jgi:hypothetical protein
LFGQVETFNLGLAVQLQRHGHFEHRGRHGQLMHIQPGIGAAVNIDSMQTAVAAGCL